MFYVGLDQHWKTSTACILDSHGVEVKTFTVRGRWPKMIERLRHFATSTNQKLAICYFGLVPCQDASATVNRLGHITKQGPPTARKLLIEAAWQGIRRDARLRAYFDRVAGGKEDRRKIALVATAHYLVRCMLSMLKSGEVWRGEAPESESAARAA